MQADNVANRYPSPVTSGSWTRKRLVRWLLPEIERELRRKRRRSPGVRR